MLQWDRCIGMKSIRVDGAVAALEARFEDQGVVAVPARDLHPGIRAGAISQRPLLGRPQQRRKAGVGIEARPAQPVDRSITGDQACGFAIADECIILDAGRHRAFTLDSSPSVPHRILHQACRRSAKPPAAAPTAAGSRPLTRQPEKSSRSPALASAGQAQVVIVMVTALIDMPTRPRIYPTP